MNTPTFVSGLELSRSFFDEVLASILADRFPGLEYTAALIGSGSEVLGFDTEMSTDHCWGPRAQIFLREADLDRCGQALEETFRQRLPREYRGYPTRFGAPGADRPLGPDHRIDVRTVRSFFLDTLGFEIERPLEPADWLTFPEQKLRTITAGALFHDQVGLEEVQSRFRYYPRDVWLYLLAAGWTRISQEEHLMGRAGFVGDEIGSALIGARLVRDLMRLSFLMEREYAPYPKWLGTAFSRLRCAPALSPHLQSALCARVWEEREAHLSEAYEHVAEMHNALGITEPLPAKVAPFFDRPFRVIHLGSDFAGAIQARIRDPEVKRIATRRLIGSVDQVSDSTDLLSDTCWRGTLRQLYSE